VKVLLPEDIAEAGKTYLRDRGYEVVMGSAVDQKTLKKELAPCQGLLARTAKFPAEVLEAAPELKVVARHGVGYDNIDVNRAAELGIWVTNTPEALSATVAEHTIGLMIAVARKLILADRLIRAGRFSERNTLKGVDIQGKVLGVVGLGRIGRTVAQKARLGLGMEILASDPYVSQPPEGVSLVELEELLRRSDFVSLHMPATPDTVGMIGAEQLALMKPTAYLVNAARGNVVQEAALIQTLKDGGIAGAGLDVFDPEPPAEDNPLFALENAVVVPHIASMTHECMDRMATHAAQGIHEVLSGNKPSWPVNSPEGISS
jgi:D-3-phosphoglycerate dehydrogenase